MRQSDGRLISSCQQQQHQADDQVTTCTAAAGNTLTQFTEPLTEQVTGWQQAGTGNRRQVRGKRVGLEKVRVTVNDLASVAWG